MRMQIANYEGKRSKTWDRRISLYANEHSIQTMFPDLRCSVGFAEKENGDRSLILTPSKHGRKWAKDRGDRLLLTIPHNEGMPLVGRCDVRARATRGSVIVPFPAKAAPPNPRMVAKRRESVSLGCDHSEKIRLKMVNAGDPEQLVKAINRLMKQNPELLLWIDGKGKLRISSE